MCRWFAFRINPSMLPQTITITSLTISTYPFLLGIGIILGIGITALYYRLSFVTPLSATVDICLAGFIGGLILGRVGHVLIHWAYFSEHSLEILSINAGGLNWHGVVIGAVTGMAIFKHIFHSDMRLWVILEAWAWIIPLIGFMGWWACSAFSCGYGAEVGNLTDYPAVLVWEARDINGMIAPRFATHPLGMLWAGVVIIISANCFWRGWLIGRRFGFSLMLWSMGMLLLGYLRGDTIPFLSGLRIDQWLDALMLILGAGYYFWHRKTASLYPL